MLQATAALTRLAPTPSGYLHLGNIYSFLETVRFARQEGARILLRIDDLDHERAQTNYVADIFDTLHYLDITWHEGPRNVADFYTQYSQALRQPLYHNSLQYLADSQLVFACTCSRTDVLRAHPGGIYTGACLHKGLPLDTPDAAWRLNTDRALNIALATVNEGTITAQLPDSMRYFIVRRKDGLPAYQLASVADDLHFGVHLIVRGEDLWDSTIAQLYLARLAGWDAFGEVRFHHHPLLSAGDGQKLSKSKGATSVQYLRKAGWTASDILNHIAQLPLFSAARSK
ncbi:MAG: tRNA glutamyl-Q synthetase [Chitinophagia bacterium]|nr:tRNA glutamyl-Q synthetase [Chitinophagia bacterium]